MIMAAALLTNGNNSTAVQKAVDAVNETTPARTWDGQYLKSVRLIEKDNVVEFTIQNVGGRIPKADEVSNEEMAKGGIWYISNFMTGYDYSFNKKGGEGDSEMYNRVGTLLKLMAENTIGARFILDFRKGGSFTFEITPQDVKKAVKMRKNDYYKEYSK